MKTPSIFPAVTATEGAGVRIHRAIGSQYLRHLDPFLLLDFFDNSNTQDYLAGFPSHPHRGFVTFTYMLDGQMEHQDSMGHRGVIGPGDAQWMKAAHGVVHSEMPKQIAGRMRGFQLWLNLPASEKLSTPDYLELAAADFPSIETSSAQVKLLAGNYAGCQAPITDVLTKINYLDVTLPPGASFKVPMQKGHIGFLFCYQGNLQLGDRLLPEQHIAITEQSETTVQAGPKGAGLLAVSAKPIGEPIVQHGPFVMNTREEITQAMQDYRDGTLTTLAPL